MYKLPISKQIGEINMVQGMPYIKHSEKESEKEIPVEEKQKDAAFYEGMKTAQDLIKTLYTYNDTELREIFNFGCRTTVNEILHVFTIFEIRNKVTAYEEKKKIPVRGDEVLIVNGEKGIYWGESDDGRHWILIEDYHEPQLLTEKEFKKTGNNRKE